MNPVLKLEGDMLMASVDLSTRIDNDKDGKPSLELSCPLVLKIHAAEAIGEVLHKDFSQFEAIIAGLGYKIDLIKKP